MEHCPLYDKRKPCRGRTVLIKSCVKPIQEHLASIDVDLTDTTLPKTEWELILCRAGKFDLSEKEIFEMHICQEHRDKLGLLWKQGTGKHCQHPNHRTLGKWSSSIRHIIGPRFSQRAFQQTGILIPFGSGLCKHCYAAARPSSSSKTDSQFDMIKPQTEQPSAPASATTTLYPSLHEQTVANPIPTAPPIDVFYDPQQIARGYELQTGHDQPTREKNVSDRMVTAGGGHGAGPDSTPKRQRASGGFQQPEGKRSKQEARRASLMPQKQLPQRSQDSSSSSSSSDESSDDDDDDNDEPPKCCIESCEQIAQTDRNLTVFLGIWTLKKDCYGKKPEKLFICSAHRINASKISGHPKKWVHTFDKQLESLFMDTTTVIKKLKCADSRCERKGEEVVVSHHVGETACPYHTVTVPTPSMGPCNVYYPCHSCVSQLDHRRTVDSTSSNPCAFVCDKCSEQYRYYATQMETDIKLHFSLFEHELPGGQGVSSAAVTNEVIKSPGAVQSLKRKLTAIWSEPENIRCEGMSDPNLLEWYYEQLSKNKPITIPGLILIRLPDGEKSVIFSTNCAGQKQKQSTRCGSCIATWNKHHLKRTIENWKKIKESTLKLQGNISAMPRAVLEQEVVKLRQHLRNAQYKASALKRRLNALEKQVAMPQTLKVTALRFEMLIDSALKAGIVEENSTLFLLLLATVRNLRVQESKVSSRKGRSRGYRYSVEVLKMAAWLLHKCRRAGYTSLTEILPGLPSLHTMQRFRATFSSTVEPIDLPQLESMLNLMKQHKSKWVGGIAWDEMAIQKGIIISQRTGDAVGFEDLPDPSEMEKSYTAMALTTTQRTVATQEPPTMDSFQFADFTDEQLAQAADAIPDDAQDVQQGHEDESDNDADNDEEAEVGTGDNNEESYNKAIPERRLAKQILVFFWTSISGDFTAPVATFALDSVTHTKFKPIFERVFNSFDAVVEQVGIDLETRFVVCDGSTYSDAFFRRSNHKDHRLPYPGKPDTLLWVISDPPHLMKKLRNVLLNLHHSLTYVYNKKLVHSKKRNDDLDEVYSDDEGIETISDSIPGTHRRPDIYVTKDDLKPDDKSFKPSVSVFRPEPTWSKVEIPLHSRYFLTKTALSGETVLKSSHIEVTPKTKMNVRMAVQTCSSVVADYIWETYIAATVQKLEGRTTENDGPNPFPWPLAEFLRQAESMFSVLNATMLYFNERVYTENVKPKPGMFLWVHKLIKCLLFFKKWKRQLKECGLDIGKAFITMPCYRHLKRTIRAAIGLFLEIYRLHKDVPICPRAVNQDCVENYFSLHRERVATKNPTLQQVREGTASLSFLFQYRAGKALDTQIGAYGAAHTIGAPVPAITQSHGQQKDPGTVPGTDQQHEALRESNFDVTQGYELDPRDKYEVRRHLTAALNVAKLKLPTSAITGTERTFLEASERRDGLRLLHEIFNYLHCHCRKWFFPKDKNYYNINVFDVTGAYVHSGRFQLNFWSDDFLYKLGANLPFITYQEKLFKHFFHRTYIYFIRLDGLSPNEHRETALRARLMTNMGEGASNSLERTGRNYGDVCLRCKQVGHWATECPEPEDANHLQARQCFNCQGYGHIARHCPHERQSMPYHGYPAGVTLRMVIDKLPTKSLADYDNYISIISQGIAQHSTEWTNYRMTPGHITGSMAQYSLLQLTEKKQKPQAASARIRKAYYNHHRGKQGSLDKLNKEVFATRKGQIDSEISLKWGTEHEKSAIVTLLSNIATIRPDESNEFRATGLIDIDDHVSSSPDGMMVFDLEPKNVAIEIKCAFQNGRGHAARRLPWKHYIQVTLEMAALKTDVAYYISWSPIKTTLFVVKRAETFEKRLVAYLQHFAEDALSNKKIKVHDGQHQSEAVELLREAQNLAEGYQQPNFVFASVVEQEAKTLTIDVMRKVAEFHAAKSV